MKHLKMLMLGLIVTVLTGCATTLATNVKAERKTLNIEIVKVVDPVSYSIGRVTYTPAVGYRFIGAWVAIENKTKQDMVVKLDKYELAYKKDPVSSPVFVDMDAIITMQANVRPVLSSGEKISRFLVYSFPLDNTPDRMVIPDAGDVTFPSLPKK